MRVELPSILVLALAASQALAGAPKKTAKPPTSADPYAAYAQGDYAASLERFRDHEVAHPHDPAAKINVGSAEYKLGRYDAATRSFEGAATSAPDKLRAQALYDLGNAAFRQGRLQAAIDAYEQALKLAQKDPDAQHNLELAKKKMQEMRSRSAAREQHEQQQSAQQSPPGQPQQSQAGDNEPPKDNAAQGGQKEPQQQAGEKPQPTPGSKSDEAQPQAHEPQAREQPRDESAGADEKVTPKPGDANATDGAASQTPTPKAKMDREAAERALRGLEERRPQRSPSRPTRASGPDW